jgi:hypothetical protein
MCARALYGLSLCALLLLARPASAVTLGFYCLTDNLAGDCTIGEDQLTVELSDQGGGVVEFHFRNAGPEASVISEIYFDDGSLLVLSAVIDGPGVDFEPDADPPNLPGGEEAIPPFQVTEGFLAESVPSPSMNGAGPSEWVKIQFNLQGGQTIADVIDELTNGELRIGIHVIAFESGGSESFINLPIPEPASGLLVGLGLLGVAAARAGRRGGRPAIPSRATRRSRCE